ncbi:DDE-type integrase/transposase/recombinase [Arthrobacter sp. NA-172]|uniref:DDE-type integrase/transposase/recombinase n=1 Tax=Arthrobacter sp. NA-172 TaxID=3367524 RepID=UPI00375444D0
MDSVSQDFVDTMAGFALVMSNFTPDIKIRLLVATWPEDAPRGAVARFCRQHKVSRSWFYKVRAAAEASGSIRAMELGSTKPKSSPAQIGSGMVEVALLTRDSLEQAGYDHGPLSVAAKMRRQGFEPPSRATLARIFTRAGVVVPEPRKKPRSALRRFVYPEPNGCWQIDSTEWMLAKGTKVAIFQIVDDHSRLALASLVASGETSEAAIRVVKTAIERHGVPRKFLSDNGSAFNPTRMGRTGALVDYLKSLGVEPITGKPYKPTTQGKNERFHRTLHRFLNKQPPAATMEELQAHIDTFDQYYNTEREHQSLPPGTTPIEAWNTTPKAMPPQPPTPETTKANARRSVRRTANLHGEATVVGTRFKLGKEYIGHEIHVLYDDETIMFFDTRGTEIISHQRPPKGALRGSW